MLNKKQYLKQYYENNREKLIKSISEWQSENKEKVREYKRKSKHKKKEKLRKIVIDIKSKSQCKCGESHIRCLDFHHLRNKDTMISLMVNGGVKEEILRNEISKCLVVCSNCHRKIHYSKPPVSRLKKFKLAYSIKTQKGCSYCGEKHYSCLDFHHVKGTKIDTIGQMTRNKKYSFEDLQTEIEKCVVVCSNCHRKIHFSEQ